MPSIPNLLPPLSNPRLVEDPVTGQRKFSDAAIQRQIDDAITLLPQGATGAVIAVVDKSGVHGTIVAKKGDWTITFTGTKWWGGDYDVAGEVKFQW